MRMEVGPFLQKCEGRMVNQYRYCYLNRNARCIWGECGIVLSFSSPKWVCIKFGARGQVSLPCRTIILLRHDRWNSAEKWLINGFVSVGQKMLFTLLYEFGRIGFFAYSPFACSLPKFPICRITRNFCIMCRVFGKMPVYRRNLLALKRPVTHLHRCKTENRALYTAAIEARPAFITHTVRGNSRRGRCAVH